MYTPFHAFIQKGIKRPAYRFHIPTVCCEELHSLTCKALVCYLKNPVNPLLLWAWALFPYTQNKRRDKAG
jgi:hypothetical protein